MSEVLECRFCIYKAEASNREVALQLLAQHVRDIHSKKVDEPKKIIVQEKVPGKIVRLADYT